MSRFKLITFDATHTLLTFRVPPAQQYARCAKSFGIEVDEKRLQDSFRRQWSALCKAHPNFGAHTGLTSRQWWTHFVEATFLEGGSEHHPRLRDVAAQLYESFATKESWAVKADAEQTLDALRGKDANLELGIISNTDERLHAVLADLGLKDKFDFVICSVEVKCMKPDAAIFQKALDQCKKFVPPSQAVHVGDDVDLDYHAARNASWQAILLKTKKNETMLGNVDASYVANDLKDIPALVAK